MAESSDWVTGIEGNFPVHRAVVDVMPHKHLISAESYGVSDWTITAKLTVILSDGRLKRYFLKCASGIGARPLTEGEFHSASLIHAAVPGLVPKAAGWGQYLKGETQVFFFLGDFHDLDLRTAPEPTSFTSQLAELHRNGVSPNGMFGFPVPTVCGRLERTVTWEKCWATLYARQLQDVVTYDKQANGQWPNFDIACRHVIDVIIPRLLLPLQSEGRSITPALIHGELWEGNLGIDMETGRTVLFDPGSTYAHNEMEFGTWRCSWAYYFSSHSYIRSYQEHIEPSEPKEEWDDRNRLYSLRAHLNDSAGHPGSPSRQTAYNDMLYLCEKYGSLSNLEKYDPEKDVSVTGA